MSEQSILICRACTYPLGLRWPMRRGGTDGGCQNCGNDTHLGEFSAQDGHGIISRQAARIASLEQANAELRERVTSLAGVWWEKAVVSHEEANRIRRTCRLNTDAEERCTVRGDVLNRCAEELRMLLTNTGGE